VTHSQRPPEICEVAEILRALPAPWAVAGGWALDLPLGRVTRAHADVDIAVFREDQAALRSALSGWQFEVAKNGALVPWTPDVWLELPVHELHARPTENSLSRPLEFLLNEREGADWAYRRDRTVRLPLTRALRVLGDNVRVLAPEIVLLYKSKAPRPVDEADFRAALPLLDSEARAWLRAGILHATPGHPWIASLSPES